MSPIVPAKMAPSCSLRDGWDRWANLTPCLAHQASTERLDDHGRRLVVRRDVQADHGQLAIRHGEPGRRRDPAPPVLGAERVADLPQVRAAQQRGEDLKQPEQYADRWCWRLRGDCGTSTQGHRSGRPRTRKRSTPSTHGLAPTNAWSRGARPGLRRPGRPRRPPGYARTPSAAAAGPRRLRRPRQSRQWPARTAARQARCRCRARAVRGQEQGRRPEGRSHDGREQHRLKHEALPDRALRAVISAAHDTRTKPANADEAAERTVSFPRPAAGRCRNSRGRTIR